MIMLSVYCNIVVSGGCNCDINTFVGSTVNKPPGSIRCLVKHEFGDIEVKLGTVVEDGTVVRAPCGWFRV